jgi:primosomal protein N' (replication factor Y)
MSMSDLFEVAVNFPRVNCIFHYKGEQDNISAGSIVEIPFGKRKAMGCVLKSVAPSKKEEKFKIKNITQVLEDGLDINEHELEFFKWVSSYYHYSLGKLIFDCLPKPLKRPRTLVPLKGKGQEFEGEPNDNQRSIIDKLSVGLNCFSHHLIHGVTGSGKSLIYLELMKKVLKQGKSVLFLLPEINLTPQFLEFFSTHLGHDIFPYHGSVSNSEKYGLWKHVKTSDKPFVVVGARSSIFLPIRSLGLIVVDEEHDSSFKQDDRCPYNARDISIKLAQLKGIPVILGSATPSMESYYRSQKSNSYYELRERVQGGGFPKIELIETKAENFSEEELTFFQEHWPLSKKSYDLIVQAFSRNEQALVMVNRLGFASYLQCFSCGDKFECPNCSANLRYFKKTGQLNCSHCESKFPAPDSCPKCGDMNLVRKGFGSEKVQEILEGLFPHKIIERFDRDEIKNQKKLEEKLGQFHRQEIDLFVGTQMLSKGHNFSKVNLVIVMGIDSQFCFPDFRAQERGHQLLTQIIGRAGRFHSESTVAVQTLSRLNPVFDLVERHSFDEFYKGELDVREVLSLPPYSRMAQISLTGKNQEKLIDICQSLSLEIREFLSKHFPKVLLLGPKPANIEKRVNQYTWCFSLNSQELGQLHGAIHNLDQIFSKHSSVSVKVDIDPQTLV